jgi:hypothetical protein
MAKWRGAFDPMCNRENKTKLQFLECYLTYRSVRARQVAAQSQPPFCQPVACFDGFVCLT